jgi:hypothetical protein
MHTGHNERALGHFALGSLAGAPIVKGALGLASLKVFASGIMAKTGVVASEIVATELAANSGRHIILGLEKFGLEEVAERVGAETLLNDPAWKNTLLQNIANPESKFTVSLEGLSGETPYSQIMSAVQKGMLPNTSPTNWKLAQLYQAGRLSEVTLVNRAVEIIANPFK